ncbi:putative 2-heptaprenyl-1,4-naphthoquinone methyltransferase [Aureobasidium pullulans]|uniref:2-heptaprenyl-1,4-naphthoquinone methyltransferase n=2 Tax=Aureobasidium pullulans TaxID=5580 RepID=A0A4S8SPF3_AURPU|nr:putative 2-heptaprenyl-1,4-naphthoquinone methyltransferase [Aureobasidium pullulans EXF-150]THV72609.1 putative 2-heptaprenyl-1,4-naphthoquinone methyltransferase [Aureobasidium pullulans]KEQ84793.1 putative 2-heptaprenyl-1,4-naphthoquinone methyltransferase [Aureobasidium pullulans EXF-150]THW52919.1 putative 2-heptaprenyl-1,4-naphthoquinone methyltransferase [Aureobasidium pullulans]THW77016.1 putative 2-heptaprenyl-1,4-naphthoquinone methyltransferase [Aureobasidium pullulans]THX04388.1
MTSAPSGQLNPSAQSGFSNAALYDKHRPSFPAHSVSVLLDGVRVADSPQATVVDLAAGTGKFTELLAARDEGYEIIAIEPHADMRKVLEDKHLKGVSVRHGLSTDMKSLKDESVDAVIAAQAFHWFANLESLEEINRVLQPHGAFGMIWNIEDYNAPKAHAASTGWEQKLQDLIHTFDDNQPRFRHEKWRSVFDSQLSSNPFSITTSAEPLFALPLAENTEEWSVWLTKEAIWQRFSTLSQIAVLESEEKEKVKSTFEEALKMEDVEKNEKGEVKLHGMTVSAWTTKIPQKGAESLLTTVKDALAGRT